MSTVDSAETLAHCLLNDNEFSSDHSNALKLKACTTPYEIKQVINDSTSAAGTPTVQSVNSDKDGIVYAGDGAISVDAQTMSPNLSVEDEYGYIHLSSKAGFSSCRLNCCIVRGRWQFEVLLLSGGLFQIGWATRSTPFTSEEGVGDSTDSFAYDGLRQLKWQQRAQKYGELWALGDVISCVIDVDAGCCTFARNGTYFGTAFTSIKVDSVESALFPALSLGEGQACLVNGGSHPFRFPLDSYTPLSRPALSPTGVTTLSLMLRLLDSYASKVVGDELVAVSGLEVPMIGLSQEQICALTDVIPILASDIVAAVLADTHAAEEVFLRWLMNLSPSRLNLVLSLLCRFSDRWECTCVVMELFRNVGVLHLTSVEQELLEPGASKSIAIGGAKSAWSYLSFATRLCKIPAVLSLWCSTGVVSYHRDLEYLFGSKKYTDADLEKILPVAWWPGADAHGCSQSTWTLRNLRLTGLMQDMENLQTVLFRTLMAGAETSASGTSGSTSTVNSVTTSSKPFVHWLVKVCEQNSPKLRNRPPPGLVDDGVFRNLFHVVLRYLGTLCSGNAETYCRFVDDLPGPMLENMDLPRLGGEHSHLKKEYPLEYNNSKSEASAVPLEVYTCMYMFYAFGMRSFWRGFRNCMGERKAVLSRWETLMKSSNPSAALVHQIVPTIQRACRQAAWSRLRVSGASKEDQMLGMAVFGFGAMRTASTAGDHLRYIPLVVLDGSLDIFHVLRKGPVSFDLLQGGRIEHVSGIADFLTAHLCDNRLVHPTSRELILDTVTVLLQYRSYRILFEQSEVAQKHLMKNLLKLFCGDGWIGVLHIMIRFWAGSGFAEPSHGDGTPDEFCSTIFQKQFQIECARSADLKGELLNKLFSRLNWAFSETKVALQSILDARDAGGRTENFEGGDRRCRRALATFEISGMLLRLVEYCSLSIPDMLIGRGADVVRSYLCSSLLYVLNNFTVPTVLVQVTPLEKSTTSREKLSLFKQVLEMRLPQLEGLSYNGILPPVCGIISALYTARSDEPGGDVMRSRLIEGFVQLHDMFRSEAFHFLFGFFGGIRTDQHSAVLENVSKFSTDVQSAVDLLKQKSDSKGNDVDGDDTGETDDCPICFSNPMDTSCVPCGHRCCWLCASKHRIHSKQCMFCNSVVDDLVRDTTI